MRSQSCVLATQQRINNNFHSFSTRMIPRSLCAVPWDTTRKLCWLEKVAGKQEKFIWVAEAPPGRESVKMRWYRERIFMNFLRYLDLIFEDPHTNMNDDRIYAGRWTDTTVAQKRSNMKNSIWKMWRQPKHNRKRFEIKWKIKIII